MLLAFSSFMITKPNVQRNFKPALITIITSHTNNAVTNSLVQPSELLCIEMNATFFLCCN